MSSPSIPAPSPRPRAPSQAAWDAMTPEQREAVARSLPAYIPPEECAPPEGDVHFDAKAGVRDALRTFFARTARRLYVAAELAVYYPDEDRFAPDLLAVADVDPHPRDSWIVSAEGRGLDWVMEVTVKGDRRKDLERNAVRYARLGVSEYFIYDHPRQRIVAYRLASPGLRTYSPIVPQGGAYPSAVLGLELTLVDGRLRFRQGNAELLDSHEMVARLEAYVDDLVAATEEAALRAEEATQRAEEAAQRAEAAMQRAEAATQRADAAERAAEAAMCARLDDRRAFVRKLVARAGGVPSPDLLAHIDACADLAALDAWLDALLSGAPPSSVIR